MTGRKREAVILALADALREQESWCGETHLQKAAYFLEEFAEVPLELGFILYKYGPFSFDLRDELTAMRADGLMELSAQLYPYGATFLTTESGRKFKERWPKTLRRYMTSITFAAKQLGGLGVAELERIATALYVTKEQSDQDVNPRAQRIHELKPHVSGEEARRAVQSADTMIAEYKKATAQSVSVSA